VQGALLRAQHADLQRADAGRQLVPPREPLDVDAGVRELVQPRLVAADRAAELGRVAQVVAIGQNGQARLAGELAVGLHRVDEDAGIDDVVRVDR
jgi:hypothetical protein